MTRRELNLAIFEGTADRVLWQPRLETWINHHMKEGTMPERFRGLDSLGIYDALRCSVRYAATAGLERYLHPDDVRRTEEQQDDALIQTVALPSGSLRTVNRDIWIDGELRNRRIAEFPVKQVDDLRVLTDLVDREQFRANLQAFEEAAARVGHRAEPTVFLSSSGFTELIKAWAGLPGTYYLLYDHREEVEAYLEACDRRDQRMIDAALQLPCRIFNLGDHATNEFTPPPILERYLMPRWQWIGKRLGDAGRFVHTHWDGHSRLMLPYLKDTGLHGVEALTPVPMGDMTLEQIKAAVGDRMVVLDLLPAIHFLREYSMQEVLDFARRVIDMFAPRLILGVSDEISQVGQIEKIEAITELVDEVCGLAE
ncbi:MAG: hypothetical protein JSV65_09025 [Armatimonadota bacterium]|nr:MAG: hypothetical protein JSV65_09025 [Armatimonadota bacterium]